MPRVTISEPGKTPQPYRFKLERATINIGRDSENDIIIECGSCSTHHCVMQRVEGGYVLRDEGSTNGIKSDGTPMDVIDLFDGMEVLVGDIPLKFRLSDEEIEALSQEEFVVHERKKLPPMPEQAAPHEEEHRPSTSSPRASHAGRHQTPAQGGNETMKTLLILVLMALAIAAGMTLRHYTETGDFLPTKLM